MLTVRYLFTGQRVVVTLRTYQFFLKLELIGLAKTNADLKS
jgi:hypothetical protein